jgi:hypothetical protein
MRGGKVTLAGALALLLTAACLRTGDENVSHPTLADWKDRLALTGIVDRGQDGSLRASVLVAPRSEFDVHDECPHFNLQATINGQAVKVERKLGVGPNDYFVTCHMPSMQAVLDPAVLVDRQRTSFPGLEHTTNVITRFDVELTDRSGRYAFKFGRDLPAWIEGRLVRTSTGAMQAGERVELVLEPPPVTTNMAYLHGAKQHWWLYPVRERPEAGSFGAEYPQLAGVEQTASGYVFQWPTVSGDLTEITVDIWPYSESLACPFADCQFDNDVAEYSPGAASVTIVVPQQ